MTKGDGYWPRLTSEQLNIGRHGDMMSETCCTVEDKDEGSPRYTNNYAAYRPLYQHVAVVGKPVAHLVATQTANGIHMVPTLFRENFPRLSVTSKYHFP